MTIFGGLDVIFQGDNNLHCGYTGRIVKESEGGERTSSPAEVSGEPHLPLSSGSAGKPGRLIAMAIQLSSSRSRVTSDRANAAHAGVLKAQSQHEPTA